MIKVINNYLNNGDFFLIKKFIQKNDIPWYLDKDDNIFYHGMVSEGKINSVFIHIIDPFLKVIQYKKILDLHIHYFPYTKQIVKFKPHIDVDAEARTSILYLDTNDGYNEIIGGPKVHSQENRVFSFPSKMPHIHTSSTNENGRYVINMSYL